MKYHFRVHREGKGYWAECVELEGCRTQANSRRALDRNMREALNLYLSEPEDSSVVVPLPRREVRGLGVAEVAVDPNVAFASYLRSLRLTHGLTQRQVADKLGMKHLYSYQRLERAKTANPELGTIVALKEVFPEMSLDELLAG